MKKIGIITFHNSYNCGSMLESYAIQTVMSDYGKTEIINYSSEGQKDLYAVFSKNNSIKNFIKNILLIPAAKKVKLNNDKYEEFKNKFFHLSNQVNEENICNLKYDYVVAGSDQIWNVTIQDFNEVYFLNWVNDAKKIAYAPSFGAKNPVKFYKQIDKLKRMILDFDYLSIREKNGQKWLKELIDKNVPVVLDPTLLLEKDAYDKLIDTSYEQKEKYIFFYSPSFNRDICKFVKKIADKYNIKVITWSTKSYYIKLINQFGFELPPYENPSMYLNLISNAELVITTSFHGTIFSTIYEKKFFVIKNGGMYGDDDRVITLINQIGLEDRFIEFKFDDEYNYLENINYNQYKKRIKILKKESIKYIEGAINYKETKNEKD